MHISDNKLMQLIKQAKGSTHESQRIENIFTRHTEALDNIVKLVTKPFLSVCRTYARDSLIKIKIRSQKLMTKFETNKQLNASL